MKTIIAKISAAVAAVAFAVLPIRAADWNDAFGMGNMPDDWMFSGGGVPLTVISSVQSNTLYYITSAGASGAPSIDSIFGRTDTSAGAFQFWIATNTWYCASNQPVGTNQIWLSSTNAGMATNDFLVLENDTVDSYQLLVLGGGASSSSGLVGTNSLGENLIKLWNTPTNAITARDRIHKMALVGTFQFTPFFSGVTVSSNQNATIPPLRGRIGKPSMAVLTFSNSAALFVSGQYFVRPRR